jgi:ADP-ribose pyrophosphatase
MEADFETLAENSVYRGSIFEVLRDSVRLPNGNVADREYLRHSGSVAILAVDDDGTIYLIEQFRYPARGAIYEVPAGTLGVGEERDACAARELTEETGLRAARIERLITFYLCPGYSNEQISLYRATELQKTEMSPDENEIIEPRAMRLEDAVDMVRRGAIVDAKTIAAVFYEKMLRNG